MTQRAGELSWVLHHVEDLDADFARFYRVDWQTLTGPRFFSRAQRVSAYGGIMSAVVEAEARAERATREALDMEGDDTLPPLPEGATYVPESAMADLIQ